MGDERTVRGWAREHIHGGCTSFEVFYFKAIYHSVPKFPKKFRDRVVFVSRRQGALAQFLGDLESLIGRPSYYMWDLIPCSGRKRRAENRLFFFLHTPFSLYFPFRRASLSLRTYSVNATSEMRM